ncbi:MAG: hypothetical protein LQ349_009840, partial [Xanthoria aureola]
MSSDDLQLREPERPTFPAEPKQNDPTWAYISLHAGRDANTAWMPGIARLDSGTRREWVSDTFLARFSDIEEEELAEPETYAPFSGADFKATK